ncbi:MAG: CBS domain-containing protein [Thermoprotei archaeon]
MDQLTPTQKEILLAIISLYEKEKRLIKSKEVADIIGKDEGTVRNLIASLKALGLLESKPGPSGGYIPTLKAYEFTKSTSYLPQKVVLYRGDLETNVSVYSIEILDLSNPEGGKILIKVVEDPKSIRVGDRVRLGPLPYSRLVIEGVVTHIDSDRRELLIDLTRMISIPKVKIADMIKGKRIIALRPDMAIKEAARILYSEGIRGAPVVDEENRVVGVLTSADVIRALIDGKVDAKVSEYMKTNVIMISVDDDIIDAINKMMIYNVGRLIVLDRDSRLVGIVTRTDILRTIAGLDRIITI